MQWFVKKLVNIETIIIYIKSLFVKNILYPV